MNGPCPARELHETHPATLIVLITVHANAIGIGVALPDGVPKVAAKSKNLAERVMALLQIV
jgi:hypothetical protein